MKVGARAAVIPEGTATPFGAFSPAARLSEETAQEWPSLPVRLRPSPFF
jgi:hypothetical protein